MKKPNNQIQTPSKPAVGFGFGDAMFAMKNLTSDYAQFNDPQSYDSKPQQVPKPVQPKNPVSKPINSKPASMPKPVAFQQKQESTLPKEVFKIAVGG